MVGLRVTVEDQLDRQPLCGVEVHVAARVSAKDDAEIAIPLPVGTATSDASGVARFEWEESPGTPFANAWDELGQQGVAEERRIVRFSIGASLGGMELPAFEPPWTARRGERVVGVATVDLVTAIVGHLTMSTARLWFRFHLGAPPSTHRVECVVTQKNGSGASAPVRCPVTIDESAAATGVVDVSGLSADTAYGFELVVAGPAGRCWRLGGGEFHSAPGANAEAVRIAFASCHRITSAPLEGWRALDEFQPDVTLLIGDQIYGDEVKVPSAAGSTEAITIEEWFQAYARRYVWSWSPAPVRNALRKRATYMMLDDHDLADDWGVRFSATNCTGEEPFERIEGALRAYHAFQQAHGVTGSAPRGQWVSAPIDYSIGWGPVGLYVLDLRTRRGVAGAGSPVLGADQIARFRGWARGAARQFDILVIASPIPLAFIDTPALEKALEVLHSTAAAAPVGAAILGGVIGGGVGGPWGAAFGWGIGAMAGAGLDSYMGNKIEETGGRILEPDVEDQWSHPHNRSDLTIVLDELFELANDPARPRAVLVVSGDVHLGAIHEIRSEARAHQHNPIIYQLTSSPIGAEPASELLGILGKTDLLETFDPDEWFDLVATDRGRYRAKIMGGIDGLLPDRNFGSLEIHRRGSAREYDIVAAIHGVGSNAPRDRLELALACQPSGIKRVSP